jgi:mannose-6-phosphate isomerase-like protein (cupin superfamily)
VTDFATLLASAIAPIIAPDGSTAWPLLRLPAGSTLRFELAPGAISHASVHRSVSEIWYVLEGAGELWRKQGEREEIVALAPGTCATIPVGTQFQFRAAQHQGIVLIAVTMPAWPGDEEAAAVAGRWRATVPSALADRGE